MGVERGPGWHGAGRAVEPDLNHAIKAESKWHVVAEIGLQTGPDTQLAMLFLQQRIKERILTKSSQLPLYRYPLIRTLISRFNHHDYDQLTRISAAIARVKDSYPQGSQRPAFIEEAMSNLVENHFEWTRRATLDILDTKGLGAWKEKWKGEFSAGQ